MAKFSADSIIDLISQRRVYAQTTINKKAMELEQFKDIQCPLLSDAIDNINSGTNYLEACGSIETLAYKMLEFNSDLREIGDLNTKAAEEMEYMNILADSPSAEKAVVVLRSLELQDELSDALSRRRESKLLIEHENFKRVHTSANNAFKSHTIRSRLSCGTTCGATCGATCIR